MTVGNHTIIGVVMFAVLLWGQALSAKHEIFHPERRACDAEYIISRRRSSHCQRD